MHKLFTTFLIVFSLMSGVWAVPYLPNVTSFDKSDYKAGRQNWDIDIDENGIVYFANSDGLLCNIYGEWMHVKTTEEKFIRAVKASNDTVWCGGAEIGFFAKHHHVLKFQSIGDLDGDQAWNIVLLNDEVIYQTETKLAIYNKQTKELSFKTFDEGVWSIVHWNQQLWIVLRNGQVGYLSNHEFELVTQLPQLVNREVRKLFVHNQMLYIVLFEGGVYQFDGSRLNEVLIPESIKNNTLFAGLSYDRESICIGTVSNGFFWFDSHGQIVSEVNTTNGLIDNTVLSMAVDKLGNVWLGLDYGIAKVELQSAVNYLYKGAATYTTLDFQGTNYLGTNKGVVKMLPDGGYQRIEQTEGQIWKLRAVDDELFVCHNRGLFKLKGDMAVPELMMGGFLDMAQFGNSGYFIFSTYHGLILMHRVGNRFDYISNLNIWGNEHLAYDAVNNCIWAEIRNEKVYKLTIDASGQLKQNEYAQIKRVYETNNGLYFDDANNLLLYKNNVFIPVTKPLLSNISSRGITALDVSEDGNLMAYIQNRQVKLKVLLPDGNMHAYDAILQSLSNDILDDYQYLDINKDELRLATDRGLVRFDLKFHTDFEKSSHPVVSSVNVMDNPESKILFPYSDEVMNLGYGHKDLQFNFGMIKSSYDEVEYRYQLLPDTEWSDWSAQITHAVFTNLKGGDYQLNVQSRLNKAAPQETSVAFSIGKLWYQTGWLALPILVFLGVFMLVIVFTMNRVNNRKLTHQKQSFMNQQAQETLQMKNEQLLQYTEIISHKNEFLNKLKDGLESMRNKDAQRWVNMIMDEVNNEKKEFLFHKLFSEVQQDFISRLTESYPSLTSNDIRILSFIRINLDKKEISNLMNITLRSLDTNRYRLRKKLELDQNTDLDKFIRNF